MKTDRGQGPGSRVQDGPRILIINVNWIGDVLFSSPFIRAIRRAYPESFISCMVPPRCREVLELNPNLNEIIIYDEKKKLRILSEVRKRKFDTVIFLHRSFTAALLTCLSGIKERIGYYTKKRAFLLTKAVETPTEEIHKIDYFLNIARAMGITDLARECEFYVSDSDIAYAGDLLKASGINEGDLVVAINPGGNWGPKRWPKENYAGLSGRLIEELGAKIIITGAQKDKTLAEDIILLMKKKAVVALCGKTTLKQLAAIFKRVNLLVSNDTGPMHIAVAMQAPTVALFGPTSPRITGPCGGGEFSVLWKMQECATPCYNLSCADNRCMKLITVEDVMTEARKLLAG